MVTRRKSEGPQQALGEIGGVQYDVAITRHPVGAGGAYPLLGQPFGLRQFEVGPWQQVDDEGAVQASGQRLIDGRLEQQQGIAVLAEQVQQYQIVGVLALEQEVQGVRMMQPRGAL